MPTQENPDKNSLTDIKRFLGSDGNPVSNTEFSEFWKSLSNEEKDEYKNAELK